MHLYMRPQQLKRWLSLALVPLPLVAIFVLQNHFFNVWTHLYPNHNLASLLLGSTTLGILLFAPSIVIRPVYRYWYLLFMSIFTSAIFLSQYLYFSFFESFMQASALKYAWQAGPQFGTIMTLIDPRLLIFTLNTVLVLILFVIARKTRLYELTLIGREKMIAAVTIGVFVCIGYGMHLINEDNGLYKITHPFQTIHELGSFTYSPHHTIQKIGIANYYIGDLIGMMLRTTVVTKADVHFVESLFQNKDTEQPDALFGTARGKNLIVIQVESLESSVMGKTIDGKEITPNLNKLAKEGLYFTNYFTQVGPGNTADAEFVTLNSLYPLTNTVAFVDFANNTYEALPKLLTQHGYRTYSLHGDVPDFWNRARIYPALGYEKAISKEYYGVTEEDFETLSDHDFFTQSAQKMTAFPQPFMATLMTLTSHTPFVIPERHQTLSIPINTPFTQNQKDYLQSIHYTDATIGAFIADLKEKDLYKNSLIVIYGDHGTQTDIHTILTPATPENTLTSLEPNHVPLIIINPSSGTAMKHTKAIPGSHLDLYPTIVHLLGMKTPRNTLGQNLLTTKHPVVVHRDPYFQVITSILTPHRAYENTTTGEFQEGTCIEIPSKKQLPLIECKELYDTQLASTEASDLLVKGNLLPRLSLTPAKEERLKYKE